MILEAAPQCYGFFDPAIAERGAQFQAAYRAAQPFPHIVLDDFLNEAALDYCLAHFPRPAESRVNYNRHQERLKVEFSPDSLEAPLRSLFYSFNSSPFIKFLEGLTGIAGLIPDPYFAGAGFHQVSNGGHLSIHADFDYHEQLGLERRINVLIYLNREWREEYGGCFEIWDQEMKQRCLRVAPLFNRCVVFNTSATSFHGNPEPVNHPQGLPRRSIALYYYTATWDQTRRAHDTQFKVRPGSTDHYDLRLRGSAFATELMPPVLLRAWRKLRRNVVRRRAITPA